MSLRVVEVSGFATIQGAPLYGNLKFGVPVGGAFDQTSWALANRAVGNRSGAFGLEMAYCRLVLRAEAPVTIAVAGTICDVAMDRLPVKRGSPIWMQPGMTLSVQAPTRGVLVYLGVRGGLCPSAIVTKSVRAGSYLEVANEVDGQPALFTPPNFGSNPLLEAVAGPHLTPESRKMMESQPFEVTRSIDRRGLRLLGPRLPGYQEIVSEPCCPGCVQLTKDGQLLILGPDGPTIGGYPKVAVLTRESLSLASQCRPGDRLSIKIVDHQG